MLPLPFMSLSPVSLYSFNYDSDIFQTPNKPPPNKGKMKVKHERGQRERERERGRERVQNRKRADEVCGINSGSNSTRGTMSR